ncbi:Murein L,D-transpeptidase YcbB/YkuD [Albimonas donghaensis]|uniref:Murein L,D-transpeptidase YcbB/YkuD n=1 Tax=Albimonas donghaensis TaxID=356660 RepID=A0A1H3EXT4_9RHOB|nr:L,D-transpeptidase family protein [Albimonas donghaensis]SDX82779.1 Murein L,D-transpeptidase YcbB/YkuD [Albimonas donghaensis]
MTFAPRKFAALAAFSAFAAIPATAVFAQTSGVAATQVGAYSSFASATQATGRVTGLPGAVLAAAAGMPELAEWYRARDGAPVWAPAGGAQSPDRMIERMIDAGDEALPAAVYGGRALRDRVARAGTLDEAGRAALEVDLSRAMLRFAGDLAAGTLKPNRVDKEIHIFPQRPSTAALMTAAAAAPDLAVWLDAVAPRDPDYDALKAVYARLKREAAGGGWRADLAEGGTLRKGDVGPRVAQVRARLSELGEHAPATARPELFDDGLEAALKSFQRRHGLNPDGLAGRRTFSALGADVGQRLHQVAVNLERLRWGPRVYAPRHIIVNQADYRVRLYDNGQVLRDARVVIGQRRHRTPEFIDQMTHLVVNPTWHVPRSITMNEILPALKEDPTYLARNNMRVVSTDGGPTPVDTASHDWTQYAGGFFPYRVKQGPGNSNSLGRVKFMFPNQFNIYLHDTPSKRLFSRDGRAFSHGCVRVQDPFELAYLLLAPQLDDPKGTFDAWLARGSERYVNLDEPVQVHLTYRTAWVDENGVEQFREDVYGRDEAVWAALKAEGLETGL